MKISNEELNSILKKLTEHIYEEYDDYMEFENFFINNAKEFSSNFVLIWKIITKAFVKTKLK